MTAKRGRPRKEEKGIRPKRCPFCASYYLMPYYLAGTAVQCGRCGAIGPMVSLNKLNPEPNEEHFEAVKKWNERSEHGNE